MPAVTRTRSTWIGRGSTTLIDTGFIVFNDWTYPNFMAMLRRARGRVAAVEHELQPALRTHRPRVQRHFRQLTVRAAPQPVPPLLPADDCGHPALQREASKALLARQRRHAHAQRISDREWLLRAASSSITSFRWAARSGRPKPMRCSPSPPAFSSTSSSGMAFSTSTTVRSGRRFAAARANMYARCLQQATSRSDCRRRSAGVRRYADQRPRAHEARRR